VKRVKEVTSLGEGGDIKWITIGGKGRKASEEMFLIGSHLISIVIQLFTGRVLSCTASQGGRKAEFTTLSDIPISLDLREEGYDVGRCFILIEGTCGRLRASGGFLEHVTQTTRPNDSCAETSMPPVWYQVGFLGGNLWVIRTGMESQAVVDSNMNPTFWLFEQFLKAVRGEADNPYPPKDFLAVSEAMEMYFQSVDLGKTVYLEAS